MISASDCAPASVPPANDTMPGLDREYANLLEKAFPNTEVTVQQSYGVGAKLSLIHI